VLQNIKNMFLSLFDKLHISKLFTINNKKKTFTYTYICTLLYPTKMFISITFWILRSEIYILYHFLSNKESITYDSHDLCE
jgi:hypothetical protein